MKWILGIHIDDLAITRLTSPDLGSRFAEACCAAISRTRWPSKVKPAIQQIAAQCLAVHLSLAFEPIEKRRAERAV
jgi:hypothetical protein